MISAFIVKGLYALLGAVAGYAYSYKFGSGPFERQIVKALIAGQKVVVSVGGNAVQYSLVDGRVYAQYGHVEVQDTEETDEISGS